MIEKFWLILHIFGLVFAAGSITTAYARELYFRFHPKEIHSRGSLPVITPLINIGFAALIISGIGLYLEHPGFYNSSSAFLIKIILVLVLLINHLIINIYIRKRREKLMLLSKISDYFSLIGWYLIIIISVFI